MAELPELPEKNSILSFGPTRVCASLNLAPLTKIKPFFVIIIIVTRKQSTGPQYVIRKLHILWKCQSIEFFRN